MKNTKINFLNLQKTILIIPLLIILSTIVMAEGVEILGPNDGTEIMTLPQTFIYSITEEYRIIGIKECSIYMNSELEKTYNLFPALTNIRMNLELPQGTYEWYVECITEEDETITAEPRTVIIQPPPTSTPGVVEKVGSGITSSGTRWIFDIGRLDSGDVTLTEIRPLDIIEITLKPRAESASGFQNPDEYVELLIIKASLANDQNYLDIKVRTGENIRIFENEPKELDIDFDDEDPDIFFNLLGKDGKKNIVQISKIAILPAEPEEPEIIIEEEEEQEVTVEPEEEPPVEEPPIEEPEEEEIIEEEQEEGGSSAVWIIIIILIVIIVTVAAYMFASGKIKVEKAPKKKK